MSEQKLKILVVDDHEITRRSFQRVLEYVDYTCDFALDGEEGMAKMKAAPYDVVFLDLIMPGMDGENMLRELHQNFPKTDVVVVSMQDDELAVEKLLSMGATAYLTKPFTIESIQDVVKKLEAKRSSS